MTQPRDTQRLLKERIEELEARLAAARTASKMNWYKFTQTQKALYYLMLWMDVSLSEEQMASIRHKDEEGNSRWDDAAKMIGWDFNHEHSN